VISGRARPLVAAALEARRRRLGDIPLAANLPGATPGSEDALRRVMVQDLPKIASRAGDAAFRGEVCARLRLFAHEAASSPDLRFLDAWNTIYEAASPLEAWKGCPAWRAALGSYAAILAAQVERLRG
jgi:hypothetical protein